MIEHCRHRVSAAVAVASLAGLLALVGCESEPGSSAPNAGREKVDNFALALQPVAGLTLTSVHYVITRGPTVVAEGNLPTPGVGDTFSFGLPVPVGNGYTLNLSAQSAEPGDDITCTGSYGPFEVKPNQTTRASLSLLCVDNTNGQIVTGVGVETDACPLLVVDYAVAEPAYSHVGLSLQVRGSARSLDPAHPTVSYAWAVARPQDAGAGSFAPANASTTTFSCAGPGDAVRVRLTASNGQCRKSLETSVSCISDGTCGNGVLEVQLGETCDTALDPTCPSDCTRVCGDGVAESGEQCDVIPSNPAVCIPPGQPNECQLRSQICGDGFVTGTEECDGHFGPGQQPLPLSIVCTPDCQQAGDACGDGFTLGTQECDDGVGSATSPIPATSRLCSSDCQAISNEACVACEQAGDCFASSDNCLGPQGSFSLAQQKTCTDVMQCIQDSHCIEGTGSLGKCYCGTLSTAQCGAAPFDLTAAGAPNGPCAALMQQGAPGVTTNSGILGGLTNKSRPAGAAGQRLNCQKIDCAAECFVPLGQPVCGNGFLESGEQCDPLPLNPSVCYPPGDPQACQIRIASCGDGLVTSPPEVCDGNLGAGNVPLPAGTICLPGCASIGGTSPCGDGVTDGAEECDGGTGSIGAPIPATSRLCSNTCETISTQACVDCEQAGDCFASSDNCLGPAGSFTFAQQKLCTDVMQCIQDSNCLDGSTGSLGKCYCGTLTTAQCAAAPYDLSAPGAPNGPCAAVMQAGNLGVLSTNSQVLGSLTGLSRPTGQAGQRLNCQKFACESECGLVGPSGGPVCGNGVVESGEECDLQPIDTVVCFPPGDTQACKLRPVVCGDGVVSPSEACDKAGNIGPGGVPLPPGTQCSADCAVVINDSLCGNGVKGSAEECDDGGTSRTCSLTCELISTPACVECEQAGDCFASSDNCLGPNGAFTLAQQKACTDVLQCIQDSNCLDGSGSLGKCYCGTLTTAACGAAPFNLSSPGAPNGPCAAVMQAGSPGVTTNSGMLGGLTSKSRPSGAAGQRMNCQKNDPSCTAVCGL